MSSLNPNIRHRSTHLRRRLSAKNSHPSHCRSAWGYARRCPTHSESQNAVQQVSIREAVMQSCRRELFALRNFGIGICFEKVWNAVGREAKVYARISIKLQYS